MDSKEVDLLLKSQVSCLSTLGDLNAAMAHEIISPIAVILGQIELIQLMLEQKLIGPADKIVPLLKAATNSCNKLAAISQKMNKLPRTVNDSQLQTQNFLDLVNLLYFFAAYPCKKHKISLEKTEWKNSDFLVNYIWQEIFSGMQFLILSVIAKIKNLPERFLSFNILTTNTHVQLEIKFPKIESELENTIEIAVCRHAVSFYEGEILATSEKIVIGFPLVNKI